MKTSKIKSIKSGVRLNMRKAPKVEIPKTVYSRKNKSYRGLQD